MNDIQIFVYDGGDFRAVSKDGEPWFAAADACRALELGNVSQALSRLDDDEKFTTLISNEGAASGQSLAAFVNEPGLYALILGSRKPQAKAFKRWVTHEVIPSIRRHGVYATDEILANPDLMITVLQELKAERERAKTLRLTAAIQEQQIAEMKPKASYYDMILQNKNTVPVTQIAKDYGMSGRAFNKLLHDLGIQYKLRDTWLLYQEYAAQGYTQSRTHAIGEDRSVMHTYWTQKGRLFLYDLLKSKRGLLPVIERGAAAWA